MNTPYEHTHITWRKRNDDGSVSNLVNIIPDRDRAADEVAELIRNPDVFAVRAIDYPAGDEAEEAEATAFHTRIGPPVTH